MNTLVHAKPLVREEMCARHGRYESRCFIGAIWSKCPKCVAEEAAFDAMEKNRRQREASIDAWKRKIGEAGIPERFKECRLDNFRVWNDGQRRVLAFANEYVRTFDETLRSGKCVLFIGGCGTGKTHLATAIGSELMSKGYTLLFMTVMRAIRRVKDTWRKNSKESESEAVSALVFPDLLILDEVGVQFGTDAERMVLFDVLNERYEKMKPCILISNLPRDEVRAYLGERLYDRMREGGQALIFDWESCRSRQ